ncbi:MAG: Crp/Fnr family transcriptional regulator [Mariprofundaceae bacterium]|nr:Crp/Fnr family transcriptional regulator [Mariprofundaceae bacterium]
MPHPFQFPDPLFTTDDFPNCKPFHLCKGEFILFERDAGSGNCFLIIEGAVDIRLMMAGGNEALLYTLEAGELVGELSLFLEQRTATIVAAKDCIILTIRPAVFWKCFELEKFRLRISSLFLSRYLRSHDVICRLGQPSVTMRLCRYFLSLPAWKETTENTILTVLPTRTSMAHLLSCQRETVSRSFRKLLLMGLIEQQSRQEYVLYKQKIAFFLDDN